MATNIPGPFPLRGDRSSALAALTTVADGDLVSVVDVSDTTMASTGTNKRSTAAAFATYVGGKLPDFPVATLTSDGVQAAATAAAAAGGGIVRMGAGTYAFTTKVDLASNVHVTGLGEGKTIVTSTFASGSEGLFQGEGTEASTVALDTNAVVNTVAITLPTGEGANFAVGDMIGFRSEGITISGAKARELHTVVEVAGDVVTIDGPLFFDYDTSDSAEFWKITPIVDASVSDLTITAADPTGTGKSYAVRFERGIGCRIDRVGLRDAGGGHALHDCIDSHMDARVNRLSNYSDFSGYGALVSGSGFGNTVHVVGRDCRHLFTTTGYFESPFDLAHTWTGPFLTEVSGIGTGSAESFAVFDTHEHAWWTKFIGCMATVPPVAGIPGFQDRGVGTTYSACTTVGGNRGITLTSTSIAATVTGCDVTRCNIGATPAGIVVAGASAVIRGNRLRDCTAGVVIGSAATDALVDSNEFAGTGSYGVQDQTAADIGQIVSNNLFRIGMSELAIGILNLRGHAIANEFAGTVGVPFFTPAATARLTTVLSPPAIVTYAASITPNPMLRNCIVVTVTGGVTFANTSADNKILGNRMRIIVRDDGTGGRTIAFGADYTVTNAPSKTSVNGVYLFDFMWDGTSWVQSGAPELQWELLHDLTTPGTTAGIALPADTLAAKAYLVGGGSGGGSGRRGAAGTVRCGGGGGAGATSISVELRGSVLTQTFTAVVGAGGAGGAAVTANDTSGNNGSVGTQSTLTASTSGLMGYAFYGLTAGGAGTAAAGPAGVGTVGDGPAATGGAASGTGLVGGNASLTGRGPTGGGAGGGISAADAPAAGGNGGIITCVNASTIGGAINTNGATANGTIPNAVQRQNAVAGGAGGSGGGGSIVGVAGTGGAGALPGGGGGGGGASLNGNNSGAGGAGGDGCVEIWVLRPVS